VWQQPKGSNFSRILCFIMSLSKVVLYSPTWWFKLIHIKILQLSCEIYYGFFLLSDLCLVSHSPYKSGQYLVCEWNILIFWNIGAIEWQEDRILWNICVLRHHATIGWSNKLSVNFSFLYHLHQLEDLKKFSNFLVE
jgi:hypothetical protein